MPAATTTTAPGLTARDLQRLEQAHVNLRRVVILAASKLQRRGIRVMVGETLRTKERQAELYAQGRTKPGEIVTWTKNSRHFAGPDGLSRAVDVIVLKPDGSPDWKNTSAFVALGKAMYEAAATFGVRIRWGYDWDGDGRPMEAGEYDGPHFELPAAFYP